MSISAFSVRIVNHLVQSPVNNDHRSIVPHYRTCFQRLWSIVSSYLQTMTFQKPFISRYCGWLFGQPDQSNTKTTKLSYIALFRVKECQLKKQVFGMMRWNTPNLHSSLEEHGQYLDEGRYSCSQLPSKMRAKRQTVRVVELFLASHFFSSFEGSSATVLKCPLRASVFCVYGEEVSACSVNQFDSPRHHRGPKLDGLRKYSLTVLKV